MMQPSIPFLYMLQSTVLLPRIDTIESMKLTHWPERLNELGMGNFAITNASDPVLVGNTSMVQFQLAVNHHRYRVHMFSDSPFCNTVVLCKRNVPICITTMRVKPFREYNSLLHVRVDVAEEQKTSMEKGLEQVKLLIPQLRQNRPATMTPYLNRWRLCVSKKQ